ncbi:hypothetical protein GCM10010171_57560 [Actinokineospora fastidiosa]|uniref:Uncharacterized protein n=1 Tax=Actinokineospora fastidiosa TaxID=1816 RepID=A0A918LJ12_9PSEU|nr:hypothetical protein GCM10010171_57560 [Actinokineospora fastidiosa]
MSSKEIPAPVRPSGGMSDGDTKTGAGAAYDQSREVLIVQTSYNIHAYRYPFDKFDQGGM